MKNWSTYIFLLVAGVLSLLATSCSQEDEGLESVLVSNGKATVQFSIALSSSGAGSRANETWNDSYNPDGSDNGESIFENFENKINLNQFHVNLIIPGTPSTTIPVQIIPLWKSSLVPQKLRKNICVILSKISKTSPYIEAKEERKW